MTGQPAAPSGALPGALVLAFPVPGRRVEHAYRELDIAADGTDAQRKALGNPRHLARPWDPPTCVDPDLRAEVWDWLDAVVTWLNHEYVWDVAGMLPSCWPRHPHLVHEVAVIADLRRRAGHALTGDALEEWHRYALPAFTDRMRHRIKSHCDDKDHQPWPAKGRHTRHLGRHSVTDRADDFHRDTAASRPSASPSQGFSTGPRLLMVDDIWVDAQTGEVQEGPVEL